MTRPWIEHRSPGPLVNALLIRPMYIYIYIMALMVVCDHGFHAILLQPSSSRERKILEKSKNADKRTLSLCTILCVRLWRLYLRVILCGYISNFQYVCV